MKPETRKFLTEERYRIYQLAQRIRQVREQRKERREERPTFYHIEEVKK